MPGPETDVVERIPKLLNSMMTDKMAQIVILYKRDTQPDEELVKFIESQLIDNGCSVFIDRHILLRADLAREIESKIRLADAIMPLLSTDSIRSEMLVFR